MASTALAASMYACSVCDDVVSVRARKDTRQVLNIYVSGRSMVGLQTVWAFYPDLRSVDSVIPERPANRATPAMRAAWQWQVCSHLAFYTAHIFAFQGRRRWIGNPVHVLRQYTTASVFSCRFVSLTGTRSLLNLGQCSQASLSVSAFLVVTASKVL